MKGICSQFRESSAYVKNWLTRQPGVKEESLTDWLLFDISTRLSNVHYRAFTKHEEARDTGADWEWWFVFRSGAVRFRVQAKKTVASDNYRGIARTNAYGLQIDMLLSDAQKAKAIPLYVFYSNNTDSTMCNGAPSGHYKDGIFVAGGQYVYDTFVGGPRQNVATTDLLHISNPFSCFACCPLLHKGHDGIRRFLELYYSAEIASHQENANEVFGFHRQVPSYVTSFLGYAPEGLPDWWESEFRFQLQGFQAIFVCDMRSDEA